MIIKAVSPVCGEFKDDEFLYPVRIYYEDTDAGGIVYYANYLKFAERARSEFIRALGVRQQDDLDADDRCGFVVRHCDIDYQAPAVLDDELVVTCRITELKGASATIHQEIYRGEQLLVTLDVRVVYLSLKTKKPVRMAKELSSKISSKVRIMAV